jgi:hypothetical protein
MGRQDGSDRFPDRRGESRLPVFLMKRLGFRCGALAMVFAATALPGCVSYLHPVRPAPVEYFQACHEVPKSARDHVYIFLVHGLDPFNWANLSGLRDYCHSLGFTKTYYGQLYHAFHFQKQLKEIYRQDPESHFVLIGFSFGANMVRDIALDAGKAGIPIDLIVYMGGNTLENTPQDQPENAQRIVNVLATGWIWNGANMDRAENLNVVDVWHFGSPTHRKTLEVLARELSVVAAAVPVPQMPELAIKPFTDEPTPRPRASGDTRLHSSVLTPVSRLKMPKSPEASEDVSESKPGSTGIGQRQGS